MRLRWNRVFASSLAPCVVAAVVLVYAGSGASGLSAESHKPPKNAVGATELVCTNDAEADESDRQSKLDVHGNGMPKRLATYLLNQDGILQLDGLETTWDADGNLESVTTWVLGKRQGRFSAWYPDGKLKLEGQYLDGEMHGTTTRYRESGAKYDEYNWAAGKLSGRAIDYWPNGNLQRVGGYQDGMAASGVAFFDELGRCNGVGYLKDGKKAGLWLDFNEYGNIIHTEEHR